MTNCEQAHERCQVRSEMKQQAGNRKRQAEAGRFLLQFADFPKIDRSRLEINNERTKYKRKTFLHKVRFKEIRHDAATSKALSTTGLD